MKKTKIEKGITLIALIITIVVLLILAVVTIGSIKESKIITHAQNAKDIYKEEQIKEEVELFNAEYLLTTNRNMQGKTKERMIEICKETGVKPEQLAVVYDLYNVNQNKENVNTEGYVKSTEEHVVYRLDKTTAEEQAILEEKEVKGLYGDFDLDGYLTANDNWQIQLYDSWGYGEETGRDATEIQLKIGDTNNDGEVESEDAWYVGAVIEGQNSYSDILKMWE